MKFKSGDKIVGIGLSDIAGIEGVVLGYKDERLRVNFTGMGKRRVQEDDVMAAPGPAPKATNVQISLPSNLDGAALDLLYKDQNMGTTEYKGHDIDGTWIVPNPTELHSESMQSTSNKARWFRDGSKDGGQFFKHAKKFGDKEFSKILEKVNNARETYAATPINPGISIRNLIDGLQDSSTVEKLSPLYIYHERAWKKCLVFRKEDEESDKYPIWLLLKGDLGWEPDIRTGVIYVRREELHSRESKVMEEDMKQAEIAEVTRVALTAGDMFNSPVALEQALTYFPQCFAPQNTDNILKTYDAITHKSSGTNSFPTKRFAVRQEIPQAPLEQFGHSPAWKEGSYIIRNDQNVVFKPDTPTGGPLLGSPCWPTNAVCVECGLRIDETQPGGVLGGTILPSFVGRTDPTDPTNKKKEFIHVRSCMFARKERDQLCSIEFLFRHPKQKDPSKLQKMVLPIDYKRGISPEKQPSGEWWVGEKGIIHVEMKGKPMTFLHFPSRKLVFQLTEDGKPVSEKNAPFEEGSRPLGYVTRARYAQPGSAEYLLMIYEQREERKQAAKALAKQQEDDEKKKIEDAETAANTKEIVADDLLEDLKSETISILDEYSYVLEDRRWNDDSAIRKAVSLSSDSDDESQHDDEHEKSSESSSNSDEEDSSATDEEELETQRVMKRDAEDDGDMSIDSNQVDIEDRQYTSRSTRIFEPIGRSPKDLLPYIYALKRLSSLAGDRTDKKLKAMLDNPTDYIAQLNAYFCTFQDDESKSEMIKKGCETSFPPLKSINRDDEWTSLQREWGAGLPSSHFTRRFMTEPYKRVKGPDRGIYKAISRLSREDHQKFVLIECLLLSRSIYRRSNGLLASKVAHCTDKDITELSPDLQKLYYDESIWLNTAKRFGGSATDLLQQASAQLLIPEHRISATSSGVVRIHGIQETRRSLGSSTHLKVCNEITSEQTNQLLQVYHFGKTIKELGVHRGRRGRWIGCVGPAVTELNFVLRGIYVPFKGKAAATIDSLMADRGQWVYETKDPNTEQVKQTPVECLLGEKVDLNVSQEGTAYVPISKIENFLGISDDSSDEDISDWRNQNNSKSSQVKVQYTFTEYHQYCKMRLEILSGQHEGVTTTLAVYMKSAVQRLLWESGVRDDHLIEVIQSVCKPSPERPARVSFLYWLLLESDYDRRDDSYPWRFHCLFRRFGLTKDQCTSLKEMVVTHINSKLSVQDSIEVQRKWRNNVRFKCYEAWNYLTVMYPPNYDSESMDEDDLNEVDDFDDDEKQLFDDNSSDEHKKKDSYEEPTESAAHGVDIHVNSEFNRLVQEIMDEDPIGRVAILRALHSIRGQNGEQRYNIEDGMLIDNSQEIHMTQGIAGKLARRIRKEVRKYDSNMDHDYDSSDSESSNWDEVSEISSEDSFDARGVDRKISEDPSDPFSRPTMERLLRLPGTYSGNCRRCNVTIQNLYRFAETVADLLGSVPEFCFELCPPADSSLECELNKKSSMDVDDIENSPLFLLDRVISSAVAWSKLKNNINPRTGNKYPPAATHEAKQNYLNAVVQLWEGFPEEDEYENESEAVTYENSEADEDEPEVLLAKWRAEETCRCKSGLCKAWDAMSCVYEEMTCLDTAVKSNTTFKFSLLQAMSHLGSIPATTVAKIDTLPYHIALKFHRNFDSRMLLPMFSHAPVSAAFASLLKRTSAFVPQGVVLNRLSECNQNPSFTERLVAISCSPLKYGGAKSVSLTHVLRPFEYLYHGVTAGTVIDQCSCSSFEHALAVARQKEASHFSFDPVEGQLQLRTFSSKNISLEKLTEKNKDKMIFCTVNEERLDEQGDWVTYDNYSKKYLEDDHPDIAWDASPEARRDPTNNHFYILKDFKIKHPDDWDEAWKEAEPRRYEPDSKLIYSYTLRKSSTGQTWEDMIELRRAPTIGFPDFAKWKLYSKRDEKGQLDGKWLTQAEFIRRFGLKSGTRRWAEAESQRYVKQYGKLLTFNEFVDKSKRSMTQIWSKLSKPSIQLESTEDTSILYEITPSYDLLNLLGKEDHDTAVQFCSFANMKYSWIIEYQSAMQPYAIFIPKLGDFSTEAQFTVTLRSGVLKKDFENHSRKYFGKCLELKEIIGRQITVQDYKKGLIWDNFFSIGKCEVTETRMEDMLNGLSQLRLIADKSKSLQKAFKIREAAFPKAVFTTVRLLHISLYEGKKTISGTELVDFNTKLSDAGCRRLMTTAIRGLGYETWEESVAAAEEGTLQLSRLLDQFSAQLSTNWAKPIQPVSISYAEKLASGMGYILTDENYAHISSVLNLEGASGILDWAIKSSMHSHVPLPMTMRKVSKMVNVIIFLPTEIRHPTVEFYEEIDTGRADWDIELFNDTLPFELEDASKSETRQEFNSSMYSGYQVRPDRIRRKYTSEESETKIIAGFKERLGICKIRPIVLVTEMPISFHSYRLKSNKLMQPVAWEVRAALVPHALAKQQYTDTKDIIDVGHVGSTYEFTYIHRHTERWSPAVTEDDFAPGHAKWAPGRWLPGDRVETFNGKNGLWTQSFVTSVSSENIPKIENRDGIIIPTCAAHIRHATPKGSLWYNQVPYTPKQWSPRFEIADQVSTLFTCEVSPTVEDPHPAITNWCEVVEYNPHPSELDRLSDDDIPFRRLKLANNGTFLATRTTDELHWEWGDYYRQGDCFNFTCTKQGLPGRSKRPSVKSFAAMLEDRTGQSMMVSGRKYVRKNPKRLFIIADEDHPESDDNNWSYLGAYDLYSQKYNNQPVWVSTDEMSWMFADKTGKWAISMLLGGPPLLKSKQYSDTLPAVCTYVMADDQKGWVDCESIFMVTTLTKYENVHVHNQLSRLGVSRRTMNELGFDGDDEEEATRELHNQLEQRRVGESALCDLWDGVRCLHSQLLHSLSQWKRLSRANTKDAAITQVVRIACEEFIDRTAEMISEDNKLSEYELERDEDDCIHNAAIALEKFGYSEETCAHWARQIRIVEGSLYNPSRQKILSKYYDSIGLSDRSQTANAQFRNRAELCLRNEEATLWSSDRWINKLFSMSHSVILRDFDCAARHEARKSDHQFLLSAHHASKNRQDLSTICRIIRERIMQLSGPLQTHPWWPLISEAYHYPRAAFVNRVCKHFDSSGHVDVVLKSLKAVESKSFPHTRHEDLWEDIKKCNYFLTSMVPKKWDVQNIDWDEGEAGTRLPTPICFDPRVSNARDRLAIRWPANFVPNKFCGVQGIGCLPVLVSRWMQEFLDGFQHSSDLIEAGKTALGKYVFFLIFLFKSYLRLCV